MASRLQLRRSADGTAFHAYGSVAWLTRHDHWGHWLRMALLIAAVLYTSATEVRIVARNTPGSIRVSSTLYR